MIVRHRNYDSAHGRWRTRLSLNWRGQFRPSFSRFLRTGKMRLLEGHRRNCTSNLVGGPQSYCARRFTRPSDVCALARLTESLLASGIKNADHTIDKKNAQN